MLSSGCSCYRACTLGHPAPPQLLQITSSALKTYIFDERFHVENLHSGRHKTSALPSLLGCVFVRSAVLRNLKALIFVIYHLHYSTVTPLPFISSTTNWRLFSHNIPSCHHCCRELSAQLLHFGAAPLKHSVMICWSATRLFLRKFSEKTSSLHFNNPHPQRKQLNSALHQSRSVYLLTEQMSVLVKGHMLPSLPKNQQPQHSVILQLHYLSISLVTNIWSIKNVLLHHNHVMAYRMNLAFILKLNTTLNQTPTSAADVDEGSGKINALFCPFVCGVVRITVGNHKGQQVPPTGDKQPSFVFIQKTNSCIKQSVNSGAL